MSVDVYMCMSVCACWSACACLCVVCLCVVWVFAYVCCNGRSLKGFLCSHLALNTSLQNAQSLRTVNLLFFSQQRDTHAQGTRMPEGRCYLRLSVSPS